MLGALLGQPAACAQAYGYYDANGLWHANQVDRTQATAVEVKKVPFRQGV